MEPETLLLGLLFHPIPTRIKHAIKMKQLLIQLDSQYHICVVFFQTKKIRFSPYLLSYVWGVSSNIFGFFVVSNTVATTFKPSLIFSRNCTTEQLQKQTAYCSPHFFFLIIKFASWFGNWAFRTNIKFASETIVSGRSGRKTSTTQVTNPTFGIC